ncbi:MAG: hypothetical protein WA063_06865 [Minisyncoccia bacterium]
MASLKEKEKITISKSEYNLLKEAYDQFNRQALLLRIFNAEKNLKNNVVKKVNIDEFIDKI